MVITVRCHLPAIAAQTLYSNVLFDNCWLLAMRKLLIKRATFAPFVFFSLQGLTVQDVSWPGPLMVATGQSMTRYGALMRACTSAHSERR